jgi:hypothetical protein
MRSARIELGARPDRFDAVTAGVVRATQGAGGFVADSQIRRDGGRGTATFVLRIPGVRLDTAVAALSRLAHVRATEQGATDLTGATDGTAARLRDARTRRRALVVALATASGARAARLRGRLADARAHERGLDRALRGLRARTARATVDLTVSSSTREGAEPAARDRWTPPTRGATLAGPSRSPQAFSSWHLPSRCRSRSSAAPERSAHARSGGAGARPRSTWCDARPAGSLARGRGRRARPAAWARRSRHTPDRARRAAARSARAP